MTRFSALFRPLLSAALGAACLLAAGTASAGDWRTTKAMEREVYFYTPERLEGRSAPLVIAVHSDFGNAQTFAKTMPIYQYADRDRFRIAYIDGTEIQRRSRHRDWNAGDCCGDAAAQGVDDISFLKAAIDGAVAQGLTHYESVFLVGHSNGAMLTYRYACTYPETIAGIVAVSGTLTPGGCTDASGVEVLAVHGEADRIVPWEGGQGDTTENFGFMSLRETLNEMHHAGANVELERLLRGRHAWGEIKARFLHERGFPLTERIADFVDEHAFR